MIDSGPPFYYNHLNAVNGLINPSTIHVSNTTLASFYRKYLLQKAIARFDFTIPKTWAKNYFLYVLFCYGTLAVFNTDRFGVICQGCGLSGYDVYYQPTKAVVTNPLINGGELKIGRQCELLYLQPGYSGIMDIVTYYGDLMALASQAAGYNLLNSRLAYVFASKNKTMAESFKSMTDKVLSGDPAVVVDKQLLDNNGDLSMFYFSNKLKENFITPELLNVLRDLEIKFDNEIGIPNQNESLRERQNVDQVHMNDFETQAKCLLWLDTMKDCISKINQMFSINLSVKLRDLSEGSVMQNASQTVNNGAVSV